MASRKDIPVTNLERALPPAARTHVRDARHDREATLMAPAPAHFLAVIDRAHLRIYQLTEPEGGGATQFQLAEAFDLPAGRQQYTDRGTDQAGRFPGGSGRAVGGSGGSIDDRQPMQNEHERRLAADLAGYLTQFFQAHPDATWDYAAGAGLHHAVLDQLPPALRDRVGVTIVKELVHQSPVELRKHLGL